MELLVIEDDPLIGKALRKGTVNLRLVGWMVLGSVPFAFLGSYLLHLLGDSSSAQTDVERFLGAALLLGAFAMVLRYLLDLRGGQTRQGKVKEITVKPLLTVAIGAAGGLIVGLTSVGSGSLMIVLLLFLYPVIGANQLVGTDLTQAVPLTVAAALGALAFNHIEFTVTASIILGSVPAVLIGSFLSSRAPDKYIRPAITFVIYFVLPPVSPAVLFAGKEATPQLVATVQHELGLDHPVWVQYLLFLKHLVLGDQFGWPGLGFSYVNHSSVKSLLAGRVVVTVVLAVGARFMGHASSATLTSSTTSHWRASVDVGLPSFPASPSRPGAKFRRCGTKEPH
jgi:uncharacterized membrane protein YfcA